MIEILNLVISAVSLLFSRLDQRDKKAVSPEAERAGFLQLEALLTRWVLAARQTSAAYTQDGSQAQREEAASLNIAVVNDVADWLDESGKDHEVASLRQLLDVYAPGTADSLREVVTTRAGLLTHLRKETTEIEAGYPPDWADQLGHSLIELEAARAKVRAFIAANFPLKH